jgi:hypothetical protein
VIDQSSAELFSRKLWQRAFFYDIVHELMKDGLMPGVIGVKGQLAKHTIFY